MLLYPNIFSDKSLHLEGCFSSIDINLFLSNLNQTTAQETTQDNI